MAGFWTAPTVARLTALAAEGKSARQIAAVLGITPESVKGACRRRRIRLLASGAPEPRMTEAEVAEAYELTVVQRIPARAIAGRYGVSRSVVSDRVRDYARRHGLATSRDGYKPRVMPEYSEPYRPVVIDESPMAGLVFSDAAVKSSRGRAPAVQTWVPTQSGIA